MEIMKQTILLVALFAVLVFVLPFAGLLVPSNGGTASQNGTVTDFGGTQNNGAQNSGGGTGAPAPPAGEAPLLIYNESTQVVDTVAMRDFVLGAVAAEMPMSYSDEALKAQAVASHSYALALKQSSNGGNPNLQGAYFSANPAQRMGYITDETMRTLWGADYETHRARLETLVDSVGDQILRYNSDPVLACYHAISNGTTETSQNVWGTAVPYLVNVDSPFDITSEDYTASVTFSVDEMATALAHTLRIAPSGDPGTWFGQPSLTDAGYVASIRVGDGSASGIEVRKALSLRSAAFTITYGEVFTVTTRGYGHGVGMSQFGANAMALTGKTYREILSHYYPGTQMGTAA